MQVSGADPLHRPRQQFFAEFFGAQTPTPPSSATAFANTAAFANVGVAAHASAFGSSPGWPVQQSSRFVASARIRI